MANSEAQDLAIAGTVLSCASDALKFVLSEEHWPEFWSWVIATPPDTGMNQDESRRWFQLARNHFLTKLPQMEAELDRLNGAH